MSVWELVDIGERPELVAAFAEGRSGLAKAGTAEVFVDSPLLIYRPVARPRLIFVPRVDGDADADCSRLVSALSARAHALGRRISVKDAIVCARAFLPLLFCEDPAVRSLHAGIVAFSTSYDIDEMEDVADRHADLLSAAGPRALEFLQRRPPLNVKKKDWAEEFAWRSAHLREMIALRARGDSLERRAIELRRALHRYVDSRTLTDLEATRAAAVRLLAHRKLKTAPRPSRQAFLHLAGRAMLAVFVRKGEELAQARRLLGRASRLSDSALQRADINDSLAAGLAERAEFTGADGELLDEAFDLARASVVLSPRHAPERANFIRTLCKVRWERYRRGGKLSDLAAAVRLADESVRRAKTAPSDRSRILNLAANVRAARFERLGRTEDLDASIAYAREALALSGPEESVGPLIALGRHLINRFELLGSQSDLEEGLAATRDVVRLTPVGHPNRAGYLQALTVNLARAFEVSGSPALLKEGLDCAREALAISPRAHPDKAGYLNCLANQLALHHHRYHDIEALEEAVRCGDRALRLTPIDAPERRDYLRAAAILRQTRYECFHRPSDLEAALAHARGALKLTPEKYAHRPGIEMTLATILALRFERLEQLSDLDEALGHARAAVNAPTVRAIERPLLLNDLSNLHNTRFARIGSVRDLDLAILAIDEASALTSADHPDQAMLLHTRASHHFERYREVGAVEDLATARVCAETAVNHLKRGHPDRAIYENTLAAVCEAMFRRTGEPDEIERAVAAAKAAVRFSGAGHPWRATFLDTLGNVLSQRNNLTGARVDLDQAIAASRKAVNATHANEPARAVRVYNLAQHLSALYQVSGLAKDAHSADRAFIAALDLARARVADTTHPGQLARLATSVARDHVALLVRDGRLKEAIGVVEASRGVRMRAELLRADRSTMLAAHDTRAIHTKTAGALRAARLEIEAMRASAGEAVGQSTAKRMRAKTRRIGRLQVKLEGLEADLPAKTASLNYASIVELARASGEAIVYLAPIDDSLGALWLIVHPNSKLSAFDAADFGLTPQLGPAALKQMVLGSAGAGTISWVKAQERWIAAAAQSPLEAERADRQWRATIKRTLGALGEALIWPLAQRLNELNLKRVAIIPGAELGLLPLQGVPLKTGEPFGELFEVRFAPSAQLLARAYRRPELARGDTIVALGNPSHDLPFAERQCHALRARADLQDVNVRERDEATKSFLLANAPCAAYLELAVHARFDVAEAAHSFFELNAGASRSAASKARRAWAVRRRTGHGDEGRLTLGELWGGALRLRSGAVISASACETGLASIDASFSEEQLGFTTAFLYAGARSVLASFWSVSDFAAYLFMERFQQLFFDDALSAGAAQQGASAYLRSITSSQALLRAGREIEAAARAMASAKGGAKGPHQMERKAKQNWFVAYQAKRSAERERDRIASLGPRRRPYAHPYYYAAFAVHGA